jgi:hypothetical protein
MHPIVPVTLTAPHGAVAMSEPVVIPEVVCPTCAAGLPAGTTACPRCGAVRSKFGIPLQDRRWVVISLMVFAALFLGFPILWRSRGFSRGEKVFWTVAVLLETVAVFCLFFWAMERIMAEMQRMLA